MSDRQLTLIATFGLVLNVAMCDKERAMMTLTEYAQTHGRTQAQLAQETGLSRSYLAEILSGAKMPGREAISKIEKGTGGAVPAAVWFGAAA